MFYQFRDQTEPNHTQSSALFQKIFKFSTLFPKFFNILHLFWKIAPILLLSGIGPARETYKIVYIDNI